MGNQQTKLHTPGGVFHMPNPVHPMEFERDLPTAHLTLEQRLTEPHDLRVTGHPATPVRCAVTSAYAAAADAFGSVADWHQKIRAGGEVGMNEADLRHVQAMLDRASDHVTRLRQTLYGPQSVPLSTEDVA